MADDNAVLTTSGNPSIDLILRQMRLNHPGDPALLMKLLPWIQHQRPKFMYTSVLSLAVLLQRMARAFACRSTNATKLTKNNNNSNAGSSDSTTTITPKTNNTKPTSTTTTTSTSTSSRTTASNGKHQTTSNKKPPPAQAAAATNTRRPSQQPQKPQPPMVPGSPGGRSHAAKPRRKPFRSLKKLDLSPNVVASLKGFVADLALTIPLILDHATKARRYDPTKSRGRGLLNAVDIIDVCLELMEGEVVYSMGQKPPPPPSPPPPPADGSNKAANISDAALQAAPPNAAMELFRLILDDATSNNKGPDGQTAAEPATTMDQHKFKTFCIKTLESAQSRTIDLVEAYYDFKLLWNVSYEQPHSVRFCPTTASMIQQQDMAWKLGYYFIWKRQEEQPQLCSRRERIIAVATSMIILSVLPLAYRSSSTTNTAVVKNNNNTVTSGGTATSNSNNKRPLEDASGSSEAAKLQKTTPEGGVHAGTAGNTANNNNSNHPTPAADKDSHTRWKKREDTIQVIMDAAGQASSFLCWVGQAEAEANANAHIGTGAAAGPGSSSNNTSPNNGGAVVGPQDNTEIKRKELEHEVVRLVKELASFAKLPNTGNTNNWLTILKSAVAYYTTTPAGGAALLTSEAAEEGLKKLVNRAFAEMHRDEDSRLGTRVEAVSYIEEFTMLTQESIARYVDNLCKVTSARPKEKNELIACIPMTTLPPEMSDSKAEIRRKSIVGTAMAEYHARPITNPRLLMMEESHSTFVSHNRAVSPPLVTEPMELNEWTIALLSSLSTIQPSDSLKAILNQACADPKAANSEDAASRWKWTVVPLLNRFLGRMQQAVTGGSLGTLPMTVKEDGSLVTTERTQDTQLWAAVIQLYFHSLESIFNSEKKAINATVVLSFPFHEAVLACSYLCAVRAVTITGKMQLLRPENHQIYTILPITGSTPYSYLKVTESFLRGLAMSDATDEASKKLMDTLGSLPRILQMEVKHSEGYVIESLLWVRDNRRPLTEGCIVNTVAELKQAHCWPPDCLRPSLPEESEEAAAMSNVQQKTNHPEYAFMSFVTRKLLKIAFYRIHTLCKGLSIPTDFPVATQVWLAFRYLLRHQVELLYGRHIDQWILCTVYGICRVMKHEPAVTFARIIDVYVQVRRGDLGEATCQAIVRHVKILDAAGEENGADPAYGSTKMGDIIRLYNLVFVPIMKSYLLQSKSLKKDAAKLRQMMSGQSSLANAATKANAPAAAAAAVKEGNVTVQLTVGGGHAAASVGKQSQQGATAQSQRRQSSSGVRRGSDYNRTFLQFGKPKNISLANEMVARAAVP